MLDIIKQYGALILALYGAALSTYVFLDGRRKNIRRVKVKAGTLAFTFPSGALSERIAKVTVVNVGSRPVEIVSLGFRLPSGEVLFQLDPCVPEHMDTSLPAALNDGSQAFKHFLADGIEATARGAGVSELISYATDSTGEVHLGERWKI